MGNQFDDLRKVLNKKQVNTKLKRKNKVKEKKKKKRAKLNKRYIASVSVGGGWPAVSCHALGRPGSADRKSQLEYVIMM